MKLLFAACVCLIKMSNDHGQNPDWLFNPVCSNQWDLVCEPSTTPAGVPVVSEQDHPLLDIEQWNLQAPFSPLRSDELYNLPDIFFQSDIVLPTTISSTSAVVNVFDRQPTACMLEEGQPSGIGTRIDEEEDDVVAVVDLLPLISLRPSEGIGTARQEPGTQHENIPMRTRTFDTHNLSERRRRGRINDKIRKLGELVPNCVKSDKVSILDSAIKHISALQFQTQMMSMYTPTGFQNMQVVPHFSPYLVQMRAATHAMGMGFGMAGGGYPIFSFPQPEYQFLPAPPRQLPERTIPIRNQRPNTRTSASTSYTVHATQVVPPPPPHRITENLPTTESFRFREEDHHNSS